jgi:hypothetical protein
MVVDNEIIEMKKSALKSKIDMCESDMIKLTLIHNELRGITESEDPIIDKGTGIEMTESRRQEIYDANIARADALL